MLTVLSTLGPHRLDAGRCIVTSRFRCRSFDRRYVVGALSTGRCLPAVAPRVLIMGDEVRSRSSSPDGHFNRFPSHSPSFLLSGIAQLYIGASSVLITRGCGWDRAPSALRNRRLAASASRNAEARNRWWHSWNRWPDTSSSSDPSRGRRFRPLATTCLSA